MQSCTCMITPTGEGQFGRVFKAIAEGICPYDSNRKVVAVKTLKGTCTHIISPLSLCIAHLRT